MFSSGHMDAPGSNWCLLVRKRGNGYYIGNAVCVPECCCYPAAFIGVESFSNNCGHNLKVLHVALLNSFSFKVINMQKTLVFIILERPIVIS